MFRVDNSREWVLVSELEHPNLFNQKFYLIAPKYIYFLLTVFCKFLAQALRIPTVCFTAFANLKALCFCISQVLEFFCG